MARVVVTCILINDSHGCGKDEASNVSGSRCRTSGCDEYLITESNPAVRQCLSFRDALANQLDDLR